MQISNIDESLLSLRMSPREAAFLARIIDNTWDDLSEEDQYTAETIQSLLEVGILASKTAEKMDFNGDIRATNKMLDYKYKYFLIAKNNYRTSGDSAA